MKFLIDMPVTPEVVPHLQAMGHEAVHASTVGLATADDAVLIEWARARDHVIVTADLDYPRLIAIHGSSRPGLILFRGGSYSDREMLALLDRVLARAEDLDLDRSITVIDQKRIRRRSLPLKE